MPSNNDKATVPLNGTKRPHGIVRATRRRIPRQGVPLSLPLDCRMRIRWNVSLTGQRLRTPGALKPFVIENVECMQRRKPKTQCPLFQQCFYSVSARQMMKA